MSTTSRVLRLLALLQDRPSWSGHELAARLGVTERTIRRDVDRLRHLGYPVPGEPGSAGGYRLGAGSRLPPLLLDNDEAVAVAVALHLAAASPVVGVAEASMRTLAKLDQVLPARLRESVTAVQAATVSIDSTAAPVDSDTMMALARGVRDSVRVRFGYRDRNGVRTDREVEPYRLATTGQRWYLHGFDVERMDWRLFRLDRIETLHVTTLRFARRPEPDAAARLRHRGADGYRRIARVRLTGATYAAVRARLPASVADVTELAAPNGIVKTTVGNHTGTDGARNVVCEVAAGADDLKSLAFHLVWAAMDLGADLTVIEPPELVTTLRALATEIRRWSSN